MNLLKEALHREARIGSGDKLQRQEAPIVFMSMCTSNAAESIREIDLLF